MIVLCFMIDVTIPMPLIAALPDFIKALFGDVQSLSFNLSFPDQRLRGNDFSDIVNSFYIKNPSVKIGSPKRRFLRQKIVMRMSISGDIYQQLLFRFFLNRLYPLPVLRFSRLS